MREEIGTRGSFSAEGVSQRAGVSTATFYNHFATKDEALTAAYEQLMDELVEMVSDNCRIEVLLDIGLYVLMERWILRAAEFFRHNAPLFRVAQAAIERSKPMRDVFRQHEASVIELYRRFIERGQAASLIRQEDPEAMARVVAVVSEAWNHPLVQRLEPGNAFHRALTGSIVRMLSPDAA